MSRCVCHQNVRPYVLVTQDEVDLLEGQALEYEMFGDIWGIPCMLDIEDPTAEQKEVGADYVKSTKAGHVWMWCEPCHCSPPSK